MKTIEEIKVSKQKLEEQIFNILKNFTEQNPEVKLDVRISSVYEKLSDGNYYLLRNVVESTVTII